MFPTRSRGMICGMSLPTVASNLAVGHDVWAICGRCNRARELDLAALAMAGYGNTPVIELPLRCECGSRDVKIRISGGCGTPLQ